VQVAVEAVAIRISNLHQVAALVAAKVEVACRMVHPTQAAVVVEVPTMLQAVMGATV
jgi:hypothetical protein